jgi:parallel beta-helix repeat protein
MFHGFGLLRRGALLGVLASLTAVGLAIPATAAASVNSLTSCQTISVSGTYRLNTNVTGPASGGDCFDITASNVTLFLNGHTIAGGLNFSDGIAVFAAYDNIVGPGAVTGWGGAIQLNAGGNGRVRGVTATGNDASDNNDGIEVFTPGNTVIGNTVSGNENQGMVVNNSGVPGPPNTVNGNTVNDNGSAGIEIDSGPETINNNTANDNGASGIFLFGLGNGDTINNNTALNNGGAGFFDNTDLFDFNPGCGSNTWRHNTFGTANQSCIR